MSGPNHPPIFMTTPSDTIRAFVAIDLAPEVHSAVKVLWSHLQRDLHTSGVAWVKPSNWHLTLLFVGEVPIAQIEAASAMLRAACAGVTPFELSVGGLGAFPNTRNPKVLWTGVGGEIEALKILQSRIGEAMQPFVTKPDNKPFHPHLTLARVKSGNKVLSTAIARQVAAHQSTLCGAWTVGEVRLMQSELEATGAVYSVVNSMALSPLNSSKVL